MMTKERCLLVCTMKSLKCFKLDMHMASTLNSTVLYVMITTCEIFKLQMLSTVIV